MDRIQVIQACIDATGNGNYLEIGVNDGASFIPLKSRKKWGVDPQYHLSWKRRLKYAVFNILHLKIEKLFRMTSDAFFSEKSGMLKSSGIDVCFVDGLHTYEQVVKDVENALRYLKPGGIVLLHDCNPATAVIAIPATSIDEVIARKIPGWDGQWSGDVWKAVVHLRSLRDDLDVFVLDCDTGVGVVTKTGSKAPLSFTRSQIHDLGYDALVGKQAHVLSLRPPEYLYEFLNARRS